MNKPKSSIKTIVIIVIIIAVALIGYFYYEGSVTPATNSTLKATPASNDARAVGVRVLSLLNQIQSLKIETSIFKDPAYKTLRDYSVAIPRENVGRPNPFAPLSGAVGSSSSSH